MVVLVVVRNLTSLDRLTDILPIFDSDPRVAVKFTVDRGSNFSAGIEDHLRTIGVELVPWEDAIRNEYALIIAAHANQALGMLRGPIFMVPHGIGYNRLVPANTGGTAHAVGTSKHELLFNEEPIPTVLGVSHRDQINQIRRSCPEVADRIRIIGDPTYDRMVASRVRRTDYRRALKVGARRLIVASSTWGIHSLLGQRRELVHQLMAQLPIDEYQVALVLHPNVWFGHSPYEVKAWLRDALDGGMVLIPPHQGWRAALVAADIVVGDHGSVSFYGSALGHPFQQGVDGSEELVAETAVAMFCRTASRLDPWTNLREQLEACERDHDPSRSEQLLDRAIDKRDQSWSTLHTLIYNQVGLVPPRSTPRMLPLPEPKPIEGDPMTSFMVSATIDVPTRTVTVSRYPGVINDQYLSPDDLTCRFRVVDQREVDRVTRENADVFFNGARLPSEGAEDWLDDIAVQYPGARVIAAATESRWILCRRNGIPARAIVKPLTGENHAHDNAAVGGICLYAWLTSEQRLVHGRLKFHLHLGDQQYQVDLFDG